VSVKAGVAVDLIEVCHREVIGGRFVLDHIDRTEAGSDRDVDYHILEFFYDDHIDSEGFGAEVVLREELENIAVGTQDELDRLHKGRMPGNMSFVWLINRRAVGPHMISHALYRARSCRALYCFERIRSKSSEFVKKL
jgi:hypothetical protein